MSELLPCPFCGSLEVNNTTSPFHYAKDDDSLNEIGTGAAWVCPDCACSAPIGRNDKDATKAWNTRTTAQQLTKPSENVTCGDLSNVGDINYDLDKMPNGYFVSECYMLTHDIINALGNYNNNGDKDEANKQFISAKKTIREYVWKSCKRALAQQQPDAELLEELKKQEYHNMKVKAFLEQEEDDNLTKRAEQKGGFTTIDNETGNE